jgi:hypothetical protein
VVSRGKITATAAKFEDRVHPVDLVGVFMKAVKAVFKDDVIDDQDTACHTDCQTSNVNEGEYFVSLDVSQSDL